MAVPLQPPPYKVAPADANGLMARAWIDFFRQMFLRIGGTDALSNVELAELPELELEALTTRVDTVEADIATLDTTTGSLSTQVAALQALTDGLSQGRAL